jgi:DNA polymerase-3 subunit alpha
MQAAMKLGGYTAGEADGLRKVISKKKKEDFPEYHKKFVDGAVKKGILLETAEQIFTEWENFGDYGFNKSHAADYGVIAVETAYLKAHYPLEYMSALLSQSKNESGKIAIYVADCRATGIKVLLPDINTSGWDFEIEEREGAPAGIRYGLGAVKNVGLGPVEIMVAERKAGPFRDINDFARRVDFRKVGKRALESLIHVGALDCFGERRSLLEGLENMSAISESHFKAKDSGQLTFFGNIEGLEEEIRLPKVPPLDAREKLEMERELLGFYLSDNPLNAYLPALRKQVTHYTGELKDTAHQSNVVVGGRVLSHRTTTTKKGQEMAFAVMEDLQGTVELVIFPKAWQKSRELIRNNKVVLIKGKLDNSQADTEKSDTDNSGSNNGDAEKEKKFSNGPKILVDSMELVLIIKDDALPAELLPEDLAGKSGMPLEADFETEFVPPFILEPNNGINDQKSPAYQEGMSSTQPAAVLEPKQEPANDLVIAALAIPLTESAIKNTLSTGTFIAEPAPVVVMETRLDSQPKLQELQSPTLVVHLDSCGSKERDNRRLKQIHGMLTSVPGVDRFAILCKENGRSFRLDFPNERTAINDCLLLELRGMLGEENVAVER